MNKHILTAFTLAAALSAGQAFAAQNVANTSQKGSLLAFPGISAQPENGSPGPTNTLIEVSNDSFFPVHVECFYVNERKGRVGFDFNLTGKQTASWEVKTGTGNIAAPPFPSGGTFPGSIYKGGLFCFATDTPVRNQIAFNHLTGTATVVNVNDDDARQTKQAYRYNAWAFIARNSAGLPASDNTIQGAPGRLNLTGNGAGTYDACPLYNIANFMPNGATLTPLRTLDNDLSVVSCTQDLRQDFLLHTTKLAFRVWNANENSFDGSYACVDSIASVPLSAADASPVTNVTNFDRDTLQTDNARFHVVGTASTQCNFPPYGITENVGLLGVLTSSATIFTYGSEDTELGSTTHGAGVRSGYVLWDPRGPVPARPR